MTWFKIDDGLPDHPKTLKLQSRKGWQGALALWTLAGAWASKHLTDGVVPMAVVSRLGCSKKDADLLVFAGFWEPTSDGYAFHDWQARNPKRDEVEAKREKTRKKVAAWRERYAQNEQPRALVTDERRNPVTGERCNPVTHEVTDEKRNPAPVPTRPDPTINPPVVPQGTKEPARLRQPLEDAVQAEFHRRGSSAQKAAPSQWLDGCKTVQEALDLGLYPDSLSAVDAFAVALVDACGRGEKLAHALRQVQLGKPLAGHPGPGNRQLSPLALKAIAESQEDPRV